MTSQRSRVQRDKGGEYSGATNTTVSPRNKPVSLTRSRGDATVQTRGRGRRRLTGLSFTTGLVIRISHDAKEAPHGPGPPVYAVSARSPSSRREAEMSDSHSRPVGNIPNKGMFPDARRSQTTPSRDVTTLSDLETTAASEETRRRERENEAG